MILVHNYFYFKKAVPLKTCEKILKAGRKQIMKQGLVSKKEPDLSKRDSKIAWIADEWIYDIIDPFVHFTNKRSG